MKKIHIILLAGLSLLLLLGCQNTNQIELEEIIDQLSTQTEEFQIIYIWGDGCPICAQQAPFMDYLEEEYDVEILRFEVYYNRTNQELFGLIAEKYGTSPRGVPMTFIGDRYWTGFQQATATQIEAKIQRCVEGRDNCFHKFQQ